MSTPPGSPLDGPPTTAPGESHGCLVCRRPLDFLSGTGWIHPFWDAELTDHDPVPIPSQELALRGRCDLCGGEPVVATLVSAPITLAGQHADGDLDAMARYDALWGCCAVCARLVRRNRWDALHERCLRAIAATSPEPVTETFSEALRQLHATLRENMQGPLVPLR